MRVAVVSEFYPRVGGPSPDPVLGVWAHLQAVAARDAGAEVRVLALHRPIPPRDAPRKLRALAARARQPRRATLDGIEVRYVPFLAPPRWRTYGSWGAWAAPPLARALARLRREWPFHLVHAHNGIPAADAVRRARALTGGARVPLVVSVHGGDVRWTAPHFGERPVRRALEAADLVLANSRGIEALARAAGARAARVVHLGTDVPAQRTRCERPDTIVTVAHLIARKRHADVIRALPDGARYLIVGDGPERGRIEELAERLGRPVELTGQLPHDEALALARGCAAFAMPSTAEAFGVAYVEAMAGGLPAVGRRGEPGPEEIAAHGPGMLRAGDDDLEAALRRALRERDELGAAARATVAEHFTWEACGRATVDAYASVAPPGPLHGHARPGGTTAGGRGD
ncbi:MAG TPA: glycosyltransferase [Solirubrobacteraceae bacterium]|nr:glycosyltransferase [Solirubrobacteraceae bacterium]